MWLLTTLIRVAAPHVRQFLQDPGGSLGRVGDLVVWNSPQGSRVVAALEGLSESGTRIEQVVGHIETAQIGLASSLGTLTSLSMATLGVTSLAAGFMLCRMNALHQRLTVIGEKITDIQNQLDAEHQAHIETGINFLDKFEQTQSDKDLHTAQEKSTFATNLYRTLLKWEVDGPRRLIALNQSGRYYLLALMTQVRCLTLSNQLKIASDLLKQEKPALTAMAKAMFEKVIGKSPEVYLDPALQADGVTLDGMAELYQQAQRLGAISETQVQNASQLFEYLRSRIYGAGRSWFRPFGRARQYTLSQLKYLMACLEEVTRVEAMRLRIDEALAGRLSLEELEKAVAAARTEACSSADPRDATVPVVAFAFA
ncbi:MAG: hypothetical protein U0840_09325 [Gemmataceae bacterium]